MLLDIKKNELVFSQILNINEFRACLRNSKTIGFREYNGQFFVPLRCFQETRKALTDYKGKIQFGSNYQTFAKRYTTIEEKPIQIYWRPAYCEIEGRHLPFDLIMPNTSYFTKIALRNKQYKNGLWDGHIHLFDVVNGLFPSGFLERVEEALKTKGVAYEVHRLFDYPAPYLHLLPTFPFTPTEDQESAVDALDAANNGIAKLPTGFGKTSFVAAALIARKGVRSLFLANQRVLIHDAKKDFQNVFGDVDIGLIGDGEFYLTDITVASIQGIVATLKAPTELELRQVESEIRVVKFKYEGDSSKEAAKQIAKAEKKMKTKLERIERARLLKDYLQTIDLFIVDESQVLGTDMWNLFLSNCPAPYRYTLSATDTRTDGGRIELVAATGERRYESSAAEQIEKGRLAEFKAYFKPFDHGLSKEFLKHLEIDFHQAYKIFIVENEDRNRFLCEHMIGWMNRGYSILGLVTRIDHAHRVMEILNGMGYKEGVHYKYVDGKTSKKIREETIDAYRRGDFQILLGTSIFDVGFNAQIASKIVRFNGGSSEVRETQRAGRTVRKRDDDSRGESIDILDLNAPYFMSQSFKRIKMLKEEFGNDRVEVLPGTIQSSTDYTTLKSVATKIPAQTSQKELDEMLELIDNSPVDTQKIQKDLLDIIEELQMDTTAW